MYTDIEASLASTTASPVTNDGSMVEIYRRVPATAEIELIAAELAPESSVLDLGSGVGRIAEPLARLGHHVTAVDDSADMLAYVRGCRVVQSRIEDLRIPEKFDAVLLASSLINYPGTEFRRNLLTTVAHHLKPGGKALIQWLSPDWFARRPAGSYHRSDGATLQTMNILANDGEAVNGEFTLKADGMSLTQSFTAYRISAAELRSLLAAAGLSLQTEQPEASDWLTASLPR